MLSDAVRRFEIETQYSEGWFQGRANARLYFQEWSPSGESSAILILIHGLFEHSGRYAEFGEYFASRGYSVCAYDQRGHGKSDGLRGYVNHFDDFIADLEIFRQKIQQQYRGKPVFLFGHSIGGTVVAAYAADHQQGLSGIIFSAAVIVPGSSVTRLSIFIARALAVILPKIGVSPIEALAISHDNAVVNSYVKDPLVYRGKIRARLGAELINMMEKKLPHKIKAIKIPVLAMHGGEDRLSNIRGSKVLFESVISTDKTLKLYDGFYHEILNEPGRRQVLSDIAEWLEGHTDKRKGSSNRET